MALIACKECGNEVSSQAKACPKCGAKVSVPGRRLWIPVLGVLIVAFALFVVIGSQNVSPESTDRIKIRDCWASQKSSTTDKDKRMMFEFCTKLEQSYEQRYLSKPY